MSGPDDDEARDDRGDRGQRHGRAIRTRPPRDLRRAGRAGQVAAGLGRAGAVPLRRPGRRAAEEVRPRHVPVPLRRPAHGPRRGVRARRRGRALLGAARLQRPAPDRLGLLRPAGRERRDQARRRPRRVDLREHRDAARVDAPLRVLASTGTGSCTPATRSTTSWNQWLFLRFFEQGLAYRKAVAGQLVPQRPDRAGQRAGRRRPVRALRHPGREEEADPVVLQDHRLRRPAAGRHGAAGGSLAGARS